MPSVLATAGERVLVYTDGPRSSSIFDLSTNQWTPMAIPSFELPAMATRQTEPKFVVRADGRLLFPGLIERTALFDLEKNAWWRLDDDGLPDDGVVIAEGGPHIMTGELKMGPTGCENVRHRPCDRVNPRIIADTRKRTPLSPKWLPDPEATVPTREFFGPSSWYGVTTARDGSVYGVGPGYATAWEKDGRQRWRITLAPPPASYVNTRGVAAFASGDRVVIGSDDGKVRLLSGVNGEILATHDLKMYWISGVAISPDDQRVIAIDIRGAAKELSLADGMAKPVKGLNVTRLEEVRYLADGRRALFCGAKGVSLVDLETGAVQHGRAPKNVYSMALSPQGNQLVIGFFGDPHLELRAFPLLELTRRLELDDVKSSWTSALHFLPQGDGIIQATSGDIALIEPDSGTRRVLHTTVPNHAIDDATIDARGERALVAQRQPSLAVVRVP